MLFVIDKPGFQTALSIVRDDRTKESQGLAGPFLRLEANEDFVKLDGLTVSGKIAATVYEPGVLFLKVTLFRKLLQTLRRSKFLTIQATADELLMENIRLPLESNDMLLYADPKRAPLLHPSATLSASELEQWSKLHGSEDAESPPEKPAAVEPVKTPEATRPLPETPLELSNEPPEESQQEIDARADELRLKRIADFEAELDKLAAERARPAAGEVPNTASTAADPLFWQARLFPADDEQKLLFPEAER